MLEGYSVRYARPEDGERVAEMTRLLSEHEGQTPPAFTADVFRRDCFGPEAILACSVAVGNEGNVVGHVISCRSYDIQEGCHKRYIADLFVDEPHRRRGIAIALIRSVCKLAKLKGEPIVYWNVVPDNELAIPMYQKIGGKFQNLRTMQLSKRRVNSLAKE